MNKILVAFLIMLIPIYSLATEDKYCQFLYGSYGNNSLTPIVQDATLQTVDVDLSVGSQQINSARNLIKFEIDFAKKVNVYFNDKTFSATCNVEIDYWDVNSGTHHIPEFPLTVNFDPAAGKSYNGIAMYEFKGGHNVTATIKSITYSGDINISNIDDYPIYKLSNEIFVDRQYNFSPTTTDVMYYYTNSNKMDIFYHPGLYPGAESFDLEWTYVDKESETGLQISSAELSSPFTFNPSIIEPVFKNNSSRINLPPTIINVSSLITPNASNYGIGYTLNLNYNQGYILFRIRGVQYKNGVRLEGDWNYNADPIVQTPASLYSNNNFHKGIVGIDWHQNNLNWQYNAVYAEDGKRKEVINYFDGALRSRQTVTVNNADDKAVIAEPVYDALGRPTMNILPAPIDNNLLKYYGGFNLSNATGNPISYLDIPYANCGVIPNVLKNTSGVEQYYSENNPFKNNSLTPWNKAIPKSEGYPFTVTLYTPDNTGRVRAQSGVGKDFQLNTNHETKYYYGKPASQDELDRLFGAEAGDFNHYLKNMVRDANGQLSVSYINSDGKTVATALAEAAPTNLSAVNSQEGASQSLHSILLSPASFQVNSSNSSLESSTTFMVGSTGVNNFTYSFTPDAYRYADPANNTITGNPTLNNGPLCYWCSYDLTITIKDECGTVIATRKETKIHPFSMDCNTSAVTYSQDFNVNFSNIGEYLVYFELRVNKDVLDQYTENYIQDNKDLKTLNSFLKGNLELEDLSECIASCEDCEAFKKKFGDDPFNTTAFVSYYKDELFNKKRNEAGNKLKPWSDDVEKVYAEALFRKILTNCSEINSSYAEHLCINPCQDIFEVLKSDVTPGGQYAEYDANYNLIDPEINILRNYTDHSIVFKDADGNAAKVIINGVEKIPNDLTLEEFIKNFDDTWAEALVLFHPEYCQYTWCTQNSASKVFDVEIEELEDVNVAANKTPKPYFYLTERGDPAYSDRNNLALLEADPFFIGGLGSGYYPNMKSDILDYTTNVLKGSSGNNPFLASNAGSKSILDLVDYELYCEGKDPNWNTPCTNIGNECRNNYEEWKLYVEWYLDRKLKYYQQVLFETNPDCKNCFIPSGSGFDPGVGVGGINSCVAPPITDFTVEIVPNSKADGLMRILLKYKAGNAAVQWPLSIVIQLSNGVTTTNLPIIFVPATGQQEIMVQDNYTNFQILSVACAQISADGINDLSRKRKQTVARRLKDVSTESVTGKGKNKINTAKNQRQTYNVSTESDCNYTASDFSTDINLVSSNNGVKTWKLEVCYQGATPIPDGKVVNVNILVGNCNQEVTTDALSNTDGHGNVDLQFCSEKNQCQKYIFTTAENCIDFSTISIAQITCTDAICESEFICPSAPSNYSISVTNTRGVSNINVCYMGAAIPVGKKVKATITVPCNNLIEGSSGSNPTPLTFEVVFCSDKLCNTIDINTSEELSNCIPNAMAAYISNVVCVDEECSSSWICPEGSNNFTATTTTKPNGDVEIQVCYTGTYIPSNKYIKAIFHLNVGDCDASKDYAFYFCSGTSFCKTKTIPAGEICLNKGEFTPINFVKTVCEEGDCPWECPVDVNNYSITKERLANGDWKVTVCYNGTTIPNNKIIQLNLSVKGNCGSIPDIPIQFCNNRPKCFSKILDAASICNGIASTSLKDIRCDNGTCEYLCPITGGGQMQANNNFVVTKTIFPNGSGQVKVCFIGPIIPTGFSVFFQLRIFTGCGMINYRNPLYELCAINSSQCIVINLTPQEVCGRIDGVEFGDYYCNTSETPCNPAWVCPTAKDFATTLHFNETLETWEATTCYTGPPIPYGTTVTVSLTATSKNCEPVRYTVKFCQSITCQKRTFLEWIDKHKCARIEDIPVVIITNVDCDNTKPCNSGACPSNTDFSVVDQQGYNCISATPAGYKCRAFDIIYTSPNPILLPIKAVKLKIQVSGEQNGIPFTNYTYFVYDPALATPAGVFEYKNIQSVIDGITEVKIISTECLNTLPNNNLCNPEDPDAQLKASLYANKVRRFPLYVMPDYQEIHNTVQNAFDNGGTDMSAYPLYECKTECEAMADSWVDILQKNCTQDIVQLERIRRKLIDVCKQSCLAQKGQNVITPFSDVNPTPSFESVMISEFGTPRPDCSADLFVSPYPWNKVPAVENDMISEVPEDVCKKIRSLIDEARLNGYPTMPHDDLSAVGDLHQYLRTRYSNYYENTLTEAQLYNIMFSCYNCKDAHNLKEPTTIPLFMDEGAKPCYTCATFQPLINAFHNKYPAITKQHRNYQTLLTNYLNHKTGFSHSYDFYDDFIEKCRLNAVNTTLNLSFAEYAHLCEMPIQEEGEQEDYFDCMQAKFNDAYINATVEYENYIEEQKRIFRNKYTQHCLDIKPILKRDYTLTEYHYTLYYYDQSDNLVKTVPPEGVVLLANDDIAALQAERENSNIVPQHRLATIYQYNSFNQVFEQSTPDAGISRFWYDKLGRLVASQNAEQLSASAANGTANRYSYTLYDDLGRITEVGERTGSNMPNYDNSVNVNNIGTLAKGTPVTIGAGVNAVTYNTFDNWVTYTAGQNKRQQVTKTFYDNKASIVPTVIGSEQNDFTSHKRVVSTVLYDVYNAATPNDYAAGTHYSYDINGNAKTVWQENKMLIAADISQGLKRLDYDFDLVSGKVNKVYYQKGKFDQFIYKYSYDAENRLIAAQTSTNGLLWKKDATYNYYLHGPLARTELGELKVQGMDYAYTLQGWLKYINAPLLNPAADIGGDGNTAITGNPFANFTKDALAYTLHYYNGDYKAIEGSCSPLNFNAAIPTTANTGKDLFNGNIRATSNHIQELGAATTYTYGYDQLNRLIKMRQHNSTYNLPGTPSAGICSPATITYGNATDNYAEDITYDANGNILTYKRNGTTAGGRPLAMDNLTYQYPRDADGQLLNNRLRYVHDQVDRSNYPSVLAPQKDPDDIDNNSIYPATAAGAVTTVNDKKDAVDDDNYRYDAIGNLIQDKAEGIAQIRWTVYGKIASIKKENGTDIYYTYDASGNRISKKVVKTSGIKTTYYVRDATGNTMAIYTRDDAEIVKWGEQHLYGSSRLGVQNIETDMADVPVITATTGASSVLTYGITHYELNNHLGNVLATVSDKLVQIPNTGVGGSVVTVSGYIAEVITAQDYYPFGMAMPARKYTVPNNDEHRYGFNGKENDKDISEGGQDYGMRIYDNRICKFLSLDPLSQDYPWFTPYQFAGNSPIANIDLDGLENYSYHLELMKKSNGEAFLGYVFDGKEDIGFFATLGELNTGGTGQEYILSYGGKVIAAFTSYHDMIVICQGKTVAQISQIGKDMESGRMSQAVALHMQLVENQRLHEEEIRNQQAAAAAAQKKKANEIEEKVIPSTPLRNTQSQKSVSSNTQKQNNAVNKRPTPAESEKQLTPANISQQVPFKNGKIVTKRTRGHVRPEAYDFTTKNSFEVKNYDINRKDGIRDLVTNVVGQVRQRLSNLPKGSKQNVIIDVRGQKITQATLNSIKNKILTQAGSQNVNIQFKTTD